MTPREWCLLEEGAADRLQFQERRIAKWLSPLLSASAGQVITPAQLLGEDDSKHTGTESQSAQRAAERRYDAMMRKIERQRKKEEKCPV